jgi:putative ABC transport system ATP-binding protein
VLGYFGTTSTTVIHFTNRPEDLAADGFLWVGRDEQAIVTDRGNFDGRRSAGGQA